ncbi:hypothetical protein M0R45_027271 [Rubus argutus]|uniref:Uncharacterized protein n=1 Tax=Rubus argutus TaxID=59490 RepID=A0AAW1X010_RUBAR
MAFSGLSLTGQSQILDDRVDSGGSVQGHLNLRPLEERVATLGVAEAFAAERRERNVDGVERGGLEALNVEGKGFEDVSGGVLGIERDGLVGFVKGLFGERGGGGLGGGGSGLGEELGAEDEVALGLDAGFASQSEAEVVEDSLGNVVDEEETDDD